MIKMTSYAYKIIFFCGQNMKNISLTSIRIHIRCDL